MMHDHQYVSLFGVEGLKISDYKKNILRPSTLLLSADGQGPAADLKSLNLSAKESSKIDVEYRDISEGSEIPDSCATKS